MRYTNKIMCLCLLISLLFGGCGGKESSDESSQLSGTDIASDVTDVTTEPSDYNDISAGNFDDFDYYDYSQNTDYTMGYTESEHDAFPYEIKVLSNRLGVFEAPGYSSEVLYRITDHRTITIVEEREILVGIQYRVWGRLDTGGWVRISDAYDTDDDNIINSSTPDSSQTHADNTESDNDVGYSSGQTVDKPSSQAPQKLGGTFLYQGAGNNIYGCGTKHTKTVDGFLLIWYDRYEHRDPDNTRTLAYVDINSLDITTFDYDHEHFSSTMDYEVHLDVSVSKGKSASLHCITYDKNNYVISNDIVLMYDYDRGTLQGNMKRDGIMDSHVPYGKSPTNYYAVLYMQV